MAKGLKISVSFKQEEIELYNFIKGKRNPSCYIKDLAEEDMKSNRTNIKNTKSNNKFEFDF